MSDRQIDELKAQSAEKAKDPKSRRILVTVVALWIGTIAALIWVLFNNYLDEKNDKLTLAQELSVACTSNTLGPGFDESDKDRLCATAEKVIQNEPIPGATGPQGPPGVQGQIGSQGPRGFTGPTGPRGFRGATGLPGLDGQNGSDGVNGVNGSDGNDGSDGANGSNGSNGADGLPGQDGQNGSDGLNGADGADGSQGPEGAQGPQGPQGPVGPAGATGADGVANVTTSGCDGPLITSVSASYNSGTQTVVITCNGG